MSNYLVDYWYLPFIILGVLIGIDILVQVLRMEHKGEPSVKCKCGYDVYLSSMTEHLKVCEAQV